MTLGVSLAAGLVPDMALTQGADAPSCIKYPFHVDIINEAVLGKSLDILCSDKITWVSNTHSCDCGSEDERPIILRQAGSKGRQQPSTEDVPVPIPIV